MNINSKMIKLKKNNKQAIQQDKKMQQIHKQLKKDLQFIQEKMKIYYNLQHENISTFKTRQKIYLLQENFKTKQFCEKLNYQKMRAFKIKQQIRSITFELELSEHSKAHLIVHITLLKSASDQAKLMKIMNIKEYENQNYVVKKILEKNQINRTDHYLVK